MQNKKKTAKIFIQLEDDTAIKLEEAKDMGVLLFDISDVDGKMAHFRASKATDMANALFEITHNLRKKIRWMGDEYEGKGVDEAFEQIHNILEENKVNIDELIM